MRWLGFTLREVALGTECILNIDINIICLPYCEVAWLHLFECFLLTIKLIIICCLTTTSRMNTKGAPHWTKNYFFSHHNVTEEHYEGHIFRQKITFLSLNTNTNTYTNNYFLSIQTHIKKIFLSHRKITHEHIISIT